METSTDKALSRVRTYFEANPRELASACKLVGVPYTTARDALKPDSSPRTDTLSKLERAVPAEYVQGAANV